MVHTGKKRTVVNFGPGPAKIPEEVLQKAQTEFLEYEHTGISVLEMSHRSPEFDGIMKETEKLLRDEMSIPNEFEVLFLQGGGSGQFAAVPMNLKFKSSSGSADYAVTGSWSAKAADEAKRYLDVNKVFTPMKPYTKIPEKSQWKFNADAAYVYYCANETVDGVEFQQPPELKYHNVPLVADISSNILSRPFDVAKHGLVFAGTQKNLGAAGLTIVIVRKDLLGHAESYTPSVLNYHENHKMNSVYNTPPVYSIYLTKLVLEWIRDKGGVHALYERNKNKSALIYDVVDDSQGFYYCPVDLSCRSNMNIPFRVGGRDGNSDLEKKFIQGAEKLDMISLKGHRSVGGIRASLYNAVSEEETRKLSEYMKEFMVTFKTEE
uniref:Phosphoserine aminotransferase n=1 Tax=Plectus sambesii TaxID=2011161 RepID=A0A914VTP5_9BILA